jgi:hypothetical protein
MLLAREVHCSQVANLRGVSKRAGDVDKKVPTIMELLIK